MPRVFVTRPIPQAGLEILFPASEVVPSAAPLTPREIGIRAEGCAAILCQLTDRIGREILGLPGLRILATMSAGTDHIDLAAARDVGVTVTNTPGCLTEATAELAWALILGAARRVTESERFLRDGRFKGWDPMLLHGVGLSGKRLGVLGAGRIGQAVGRIGKGFGMEVVYLSREAKPEFEKDGAKRASADEIATTCDVISVHVPLTPETKHMVDADFLSKMKSSAVLVNTARGPVVDESALVDALGRKRIFAAGLDVFEEEPDVHPGLLALDNVVLLPHVGSATVETRSKMAAMAANNIVAVLAGRPPLNPV
jgi:glyoxylate reductase